MSILFWQKAQWEQAVFLHTQDRLPHALLLSGIKGLGKAQFAQYFGQWLLCTSDSKISQQAPCQACQSCQWMSAKAHPEWFSIAPLEGSLTISIDQIREVMQWMQLTPQYATKKWIFIEALDKLTVAASHALLKILEEPSSTTGFILVSSHKHRLQQTILSRLTLLDFRPPPEFQTQLHFTDLPIWALRIAQGAPLAACELSTLDFIEYRARWIQELRGVADKTSDPIEVAQAWMKRNANNALYLFYYWLIDLIYVVMNKNVEEHSCIINIDQLFNLQTIAKACVAPSLFLLLEKLEKMLLMKNQVNTTNDQLCFETLLIHYSQLME